MSGERAAGRTGKQFPRNFGKAYPVATGGEGCWIFTQDGRRLLDAAGSAAVVSIGHGVEAIGQAMAEQSRRLAFVHSSQFQTDVAEELARRLLELAPGNFRDGGRVFFTSGGSEAMETALKLCRQYFVERGETHRYRVISRWQSYHGATLGALSLSGNPGRRKPFSPLLTDWGHIPPCHCYRCPLGLRFPECATACAEELEKNIQEEQETAAGFIFEPISGATLGAAAPPEGYLERIAEICRRHGILLIADEVMTGLGRTGKKFAVDHWGIEPDLILVGKGVASGYAPLGAVLVSGRVAEAFARGSGKFVHGFTYNAHPVAAAAGLAVLDYLSEQRLFERATAAGEEMRQALQGLQTKFPVIGDVRGRGLLWGMEFVRDRGNKQPFEPGDRVADRIFEAAYEAGVLTYPMHGCADGERGDHLLFAPPFAITSEEIGMMATGLERALRGL